MTVRYFDDRIEAYLDANMQPTTPEAAAFIRLFTFSETGTTSQLLQVEPPAPPAVVAPT